MTAFQVKIRDGVYEKVRSSLASFTLKDAALEKTYFPRLNINLEDLAEKPTIRFVAIGVTSSRDRTLRNTEVVQISVPTQIAIQQKVDPSDTAYIDKLVEFAEEIMDVIEDDELVSGEDFTWESTEPLRDENGLIYDYETLYTNSVFQAIFTVAYSYIKQPTS